jgi:hypothetical protein
LARDDLVSQVAVVEIDRLRDDGLAAVLVTGRIVPELARTSMVTRLASWVRSDHPDQVRLNGDDDPAV